MKHYQRGKELARTIHNQIYKQRTAGGGGERFAAGVVAPAGAPVAPGGDAVDVGALLAPPLSLALNLELSLQPISCNQ